MPTFKADCPRCGTRSVMFVLELREGGREISFEPGKYDIFARCNRCDRGVIATYFGDPRTPFPVLIMRDPDEITPSVPTDAPPDTPTRAAEYYRQGMDNLTGNPDAAGAMFRKTLETALKKKFPDRGAKSLKTRITAAAKAGDLVPALADWAHQIRIDGNDAAHDEITVGQARDMQIFTELVLRYLFELPGMLKKAQQRPEE